MLKIVTIGCVIFGLLSAVSIESWLRRRKGNQELAAAVHQITLEKYSEFWFSILVPSILILVITAIFVMVGLGLNPLLAFAGGALSTYLAVFLGSRTYCTGTVAASSLVAQGSIRKAMSASFRSGAIMGLITDAFIIATVSVILYTFNQALLSSVVPAFVFGAVLSGLIIRISGAILTSSHKLAKQEGFDIDYMGSFAATAANFMETAILTAGSAILLAEIGVETSGVTSTFTFDAAAKYPVIVMACGIAASVIGALVFRAFTGRRAHYAFSASLLVTEALIFAAAYYFSDYMLDEYSYSYCIGFGLIAQLLSGEFNKIFSIESDVFRKNLPKAGSMKSNVELLHSLSIGFISCAVPGILCIISLLLSYSIAQYYGIALCAVGAIAACAVEIAVREYSSVLSASAGFVETADEKSSENAGYYNILWRNSYKSKSAGNSYSVIAAILALMATLMAFLVTSGGSNVSLTEPMTFGGMIFGTIAMIFFMGMIIRSILLSTSSMMDIAVDNSDEYRNINSLRGIALIEIIAIAGPVILGIVLGINFVIGFVGSSIVSGMILIFAFNNTGEVYDRMAADALGTVIKMISVVSLACIPVFMNFNANFF